MSNGVTRRILAASILTSLITHGPAAPAQADDPPAAGEATAFLARLQDAYAALADRTGPSVVAIRATCSAPGSADASAAAGPIVQTGTGVILRSDGTILTSQHVIAGAMTIDVVLHDGRRCRARLLAADARSDLAVVRVRAGRLVPAALGDARTLRPGHIVMAMAGPHGAASGGSAALSAGLVGATTRPLPVALGAADDRDYGDMIQFSAPVGPGNSGGPLIDIHGRVVGIVTARGVAPGGGGAGGFAVPITPRTRLIIDCLIAGETIAYGYLGADVVPTPTGLADPDGPAERRGAMIAAVEADGPADRAGLCEGDVITRLDGLPVASPHELVRLIGQFVVGSTMVIEYVRDAETHRTTVALAARAKPAMRAADAAAVMRVNFRGAVLEPLSPSMRTYSNLPRGALIVLGVGTATPADRAGLSPGDVVVRVNGAPLSSRGASAFKDRSTSEVLLGLANGGSILVRDR